jgi:hypothetical protein
MYKLYLNILYIMKIIQKDQGSVFLFQHTKTFNKKNEPSARASPLEKNKPVKVMNKQNRFI